MANDTATQALPESFYRSILSQHALNQKPSPIRGLYPIESIPGMISLLAGKPNASTFPFSSFSFTSRSPVDDKEQAITIDGASLDEALQYGPTAGMSRLITWLEGLQEYSHARSKTEGTWSLSSGTGSQDLLSKSFTVLLNPGDPILVDSPVYAGVLPLFDALHADQIAVETDGEGTRPEHLRKILETWPQEKKKPRAFYTVPYGCNPTGMTVNLERRIEILKIAHEHDLLILEDDPYYYLYYGKAPRVPSYFTLEKDTGNTGRVLRFDSMSKILSSGMRIGFVTGPTPLVNAINQMTASSNLQPSSLTQTIAFYLLDSWGYSGFQKHTERVAQFYEQRRNVFEAALTKHLTGLAEWETPQAGMFFWFKLNIEGGDSEQVIRKTAIEKGVLALPGTAFIPGGGKSRYVRASFSLIEEKDIEEAAKRLRDVVLASRA